MKLLLEKTVCVLLIFVLISGKILAESSQQYAPVNGIVIYSENGKFGYAKADGPLLTNAIYDFATPFQYGYAVVGQANLLGCIDMQGHEILPCIYDAIYYATDDPNNMRLLVDKDGLWGVFDGKGNTISPVIYDMVNGVFNNNIVFEKDGLMGLLDSQGNIVIPNEWEWIYYLSNDWALVFISNEFDGEYAYVNAKNELMPAHFDYATPFAEGCALVGDEGEFFYIDTKGNRISPDVWDLMHDTCSQSLIGVLKNGKWGYISSDGTLFLAPQWDEAAPFSEDGLALVRLGEHFGYIDKTGTMVINAVWTDAYDFINGYAIVSTQEGYGLINTSGEYIVQPVWADIQYPAEGMIGVADDTGMWGFVDMQGQPVIECRYPYVDYFCDGCVCVWDTDDHALWLDKLGNTVCP